MFGAILCVLGLVLWIKLLLQCEKVHPNAKQGAESKTTERIVRVKGFKRKTTDRGRHKSPWKKKNEKEKLDVRNPAVKKISPFLT